MHSSHEWTTIDLFKEVCKQDGAMGLLSIAFMAFSRAQKDYIRLRDRQFGIKSNKGGCQFPDKHPCNGDKCVQIHHVIPQKYAQRVGYFADVVENGITLCEHSHQRMIHGDMREARQDYHTDKNSYKKVFKKRKQKLDEKEIYWNDTWDRQLYVTVTRSEQRAQKAGIIFKRKP